MCNFEGQISPEHIVFFFRGQNSKLTALCHHANWGLLFMLWITGLTTTIRPRERPRYSARKHTSCIKHLQRL